MGMCVWGRGASLTHNALEEKNENSGVQPMVWGPWGSGATHSPPQPSPGGPRCALPVPVAGLPRLKWV